MKYETLFSPMNVGTVTIKNRVVMSPMVMGTGRPDGTPTERMIRYYEERAKGGAGLIITEATRVDDVTGPLHPLQLAMSSDKHVAPFAEMVERIHRHGAKIFCQLHHPGRQNYSILIGTMHLSQPVGAVWSGYWGMFFKIAAFNDLLERSRLLPAVVAPSAVPCRHQKQKTRALRVSEIEKIIREFGDAALRVQKSGADGVELHAAHGYLIQQFLSPHTNRRTDGYGGSFENRLRFVKEIIADIRKKCGDTFPIVVRLSVDEFYQEIGESGQGIELPEGVKIAKALERLGIDAIDVSGGTYETKNQWLEPVTFAAGWRDHLAKAVKEAVHIPVLAANLTRTPAEAEAKLMSGIQDFVSLGRPLLADPEWANKAQAGKEESIKRCINCLWCFESMLKGGFSGTSGTCAVNPRTCKESVQPEAFPQDGRGRTVAVIGAGPAGLTAAGVLAKRGFHAVIFEKESRAGGQLLLGKEPPHKEKIAWCYEDLLHAATENGAEIRYNTPATTEELKRLEPYAVILASGGEAVTPRGIAGVCGNNVCTVTEILNGSVDLSGKQVAVVGSGMTGLETAELLCAQGNRVSIIEMANTIAPGVYHQHTDDILPKLKAYGTAFHTGSRLTKICDGSIVLTLADGTAKTLPADHVVLAVGVRSRNELAEALKTAFPRVFIVGDAKKIGRIAEATRSAYETARALS
ncbi:MAG: NAD(P)/FAD-dependent oxidoreductase [Oscillospiraceae bacterium]|jgi:2,4-dienoyl-CoA reductase-like NADH-dependent reductase (Old Yellow Enzyme family)/thioredoxin reductase|nr:NAD(P)/FAD-dependent oxidoreductase [Oscillospiraceae bacterium]